MKKGLVLVLLLTVQVVRRTQVVYVDDTDFFSNGENCKALIQAIIVYVCENV